MRAALLSVALCMAAQAAPLNAIKPGGSLDTAKSILIRRSGLVLTKDPAVRFAFIRSRQMAEDDLIDADDIDLPSLSAEHADITADTDEQSATSTLPYIENPYAEELSTSEEDPALANILTNIEQILTSNDSPTAQILWILDAILHHDERMTIPTTALTPTSNPSNHDPTTTNEEWSPTTLLQLVDNVLMSNAYNDEDKVDILLNQILTHSAKHHDVMAEYLSAQSRSPVIYRIKAVLYGPKSSQKKIQNILGEIADYLVVNPVEEGGAGWDEQVAMGVENDE